MQAVEHTQYFFRVAADVQVVHRHVLDNVVRINDECRAQRGPFLRIANAQHIDQRTGRVGKHPVIQPVQILVVAPPCQLDELVIGRAAEQHRIAIFEIIRQLRETDDFSRANESEVLRVKVNDLPLARERALVDVFECADAVFFVMVKAGLDAGDAEGFESLTYGFHELLQEV